MTSGNYFRWEWKLNFESIWNIFERPNAMNSNTENDFGKAFSLRESDTGMEVKEKALCYKLSECLKKKTQKNFTNHEK